MGRVEIISYFSNDHKKQVYKRWLEQGRPWFDIDPKKEPTYAEKQIILEMLKQENEKVKRDIELEKRTKDIHERYGKKGLISDKVFDAFNNY